MLRSKITVRSLRARKTTGPKIVALTAYDVLTAKLLDAAEVDILLVGDSLGTVVKGEATTLPVTVNDICYHARAVAKAQPRAHLVGDLPFLSYQASDELAVTSAGCLLQQGYCEAVKLEGGVRMADRIRAIVAADIPVMGHIGLTPQSVHSFGGYRVQGRGIEAEERLLEDARAIEQAGVYAMVLEGMPPGLAQRITAAVAVPTIGIGAGPHCDGQVLVITDLLGLDREFRPRFVKRYLEMGDAVVAAVRNYAQEVRGGAFPAPEHCYAEEAADAGR